VEIGRRAVIGLDFRMNELTGAVALAQLRKLDSILNHLREIKKVYKDGISSLNNIKFREVTDETGECATVLTLILPDAGLAEAVARRTGSTTLINSGWHVYRNMEQLLEKRTIDGKGCPFTCPYYSKDISYEKGMLPRTEDILSRAVNLSIGLHDKGIGAAYGLGPKDTVAIAEKKAAEFVSLVKDVV